MIKKVVIIGLYCMMYNVDGSHRARQSAAQPDPLSVAKTMYHKTGAGNLTAEHCQHLIAHYGGASFDRELALSHAVIILELNTRLKELQGSGKK